MCTVYGTHTYANAPKRGRLCARQIWVNADVTRASHTQSALCTGAHLRTRGHLSHLESRERARAHSLSICPHCCGTYTPYNTVYAKYMRSCMCSPSTFAYSIPVRHVAPLALGCRGSLCVRVFVWLGVGVYECVHTNAHAQ